MERNVGGNDRLLRLVLGVGLIAVAIYSFAAASGGTGIQINIIRSLLVIVGAVFLVTGAVQTCPINAALGINTCEVSPEGGEADEAA